MRSSPFGCFVVWCGMIYSDRCLALTKASEGCVLKAYPDPASGGDPWTCGWGATGADIRRGTVWTQAQADERLEADLMHASGEVDKLIGTHPTTQGQYDALTDFVFNVGAGALRTSTLLRKHLAGDYAGAKAEFGKWIWASGKKMTGLIKRRAAEAELYGS